MIFSTACSAIADVISSLPDLRETRSHLLARTEAYVLASEDFGRRAEAEVSTGTRDIPYSSACMDARITTTATTRSARERSLSRDVPQLDPILSLARGPARSVSQSWREEGLFLLLSAFDHPALTGRHTSDELEVSFGGRELVIKLPSGEELRSARDLSAHVSSVYLPCRCGEVRSVFVPSVTVCEAE